MNTFGNALKVTIFGQSHAPAIGAVVDGFPAGFSIDWGKVEAFMVRRAPGSSALSTARREADTPRLLSGLNERGQTCGAPIAAMIENTDTRSADYDALRDMPRPGHADHTAWAKYQGHNDIRGGGQFSGRLTAPLCFAGALCLQWLEQRGIAIAARIVSIEREQDAQVSAETVDAGWLRSLTSMDFPVADAPAGERMRKAILQAKDEGDSVGGVIEAYAVGLPVGLGEPMFQGMENQLAAAVFAIPAVRGVEFGDGFAAARMRGSQHNDAYCIGEDGQTRAATNHSGGVLGGLTTGMPLIVRVAMKPTPSIAQAQRTVSLSKGTEQTLAIQGRHDPCIVPRAVPCVEAALAIVLMDCMLG